MKIIDVLELKCNAHKSEMLIRSNMCGLEPEDCGFIIKTLKDSLVLIEQLKSLQKTRGNNKFKVKLLKCPEHGYECLAINNTRITDKKCCGKWEEQRTFVVLAEQLESIIEKQRQDAKDQ